MSIIYLIPEKTSKYHSSESPNDTQEDKFKVMGFDELLKEFEQFLKIESPALPRNIRLNRYMNMVEKWLSEHNGNIVGESFNHAPLATTKHLLQWRDSLKMAQWDFRYPDVNSRLGLLAGIEHQERIAGTPDRILKVIESIEKSTDNALADYTIILPPMLRKVMHPIFRKLIDTAEHHGVTIEENSYVTGTGNNLGKIRAFLLADNSSKESESGSIKLDNADKSLLVYSFDTEYDQDKYVAENLGKFKEDLIINPRAVQTDSRLFAIKQPTAGSHISSNSKILNLLSLALSLYETPTNIYKLIEWLTTPLHPLSNIRFRLADKIASKGGFMNDECREIIEKIPEEELHLFLPPLQTGIASEDHVTDTLQALKSWARKKSRQLAKDNVSDRGSLSLQLNTLADNIEFLLGVFSEREEDFDLRIAQDWLRDLETNIDIQLHDACKDAPYMVTEPCDAFRVSTSITWIGMESSDNGEFDCNFLLSDEIEGIGKSIILRTREEESRYRYLTSIMPFLFAKDRLTLMFADKRIDEKILPHPIITMLKATIKDYEKLVNATNEAADKEKTDPTATVTTKQTHQEPVIPPSSRQEYRFKHADKITLPKKWSATALENFVIYPFDFLFERILNYRPADMANLPQLHTVKGSVAHDVFAGIFTPDHLSSNRNAEKIRKRVENEYRDAFNAALDSCGALLRLPENHLEKETLEYQIRKCMVGLIDIIEANQLTVISCEESIDRHVGIDETNVSDEADLGGSS